jgi:outer membrane lipoprotein carrier protein LolA
VEPGDALLGIQRRLAPFEVLQGRFEQEKRIAKIKHPLKSRGRFALLRGTGVLWRTEAPIQSLLSLTADAMSVVQNKQTIVSISLSEQPGLRFLGQTVFAVFMTDLAQLRQSFTLLEARVPEKPASWYLSLRPREPAVAKLMRAVQLTGGDHIESIEISEQNGDSTRILLLDPDSQSPLAPEDARLLGRAPGKP